MVSKPTKMQACRFGLLLAVVVLAASVIAVGATDEHWRHRAPLKEKMPWYHTTDEIHSKLQDIAGSCQGAKVQLIKQDVTKGFDVLSITHAGGEASTKKTKAMLVFGEHARELVTAESALDLVRTLCGHGSFADKAGKTLKDVDFLIVPNANPLGRRQVEEKGRYCKRTNEDGVDLNRNWGKEHRDEAHKLEGAEDNPGPYAFSEPETSALRKLLIKEKPDVFLSVHSGAYMLGTPYGYTQKRQPRNGQTMLDILQPISEKFCDGKCPFGGLRELIGYSSHGCDMDYVAEQMHTPYAFTFEIFTGHRFRAEYAEQAAKRARRAKRKAKKSKQKGSEKEAGGSLLATGLLHVIDKKSSHRKRRKRKHRKESNEDNNDDNDDDINYEAEDNPEHCIEQFNPKTEHETREVVEKWTGAYLELCEMASSRQRAYMSLLDSSPSLALFSAEAGKASTTAARAAVALKAIRANQSSASRYQEFSSRLEQLETQISAMERMLNTTTRQL
eukprot:gnl/TRDRNA2_/TRDRNA2_182509_c0_seq1.p1 gnl/TRDRNA2_/TRDRNA2_182509_c0~~gnl/TRDRNA2_/TRDRNA2_182509_c0_seq1.p1  ORF type:complete len:502 (+),score=103.77 gnl/TRDRNA2_/TRDRNA2_182509_c0_seq1:105-1610(+)